MEIAAFVSGNCNDCHIAASPQSHHCHTSSLKMYHNICPLMCCERHKILSPLVCIVHGPGKHTKGTADCTQPSACVWPHLPTA